MVGGGTGTLYRKPKKVRISIVMIVDQQPKRGDPYAYCADGPELLTSPRPTICSDGAYVEVIRSDPEFISEREES